MPFVRLLALFLLVGLVGQARGDGGAVVARERSGGLVATVFVAPVPLRAGPVDVSVLVQDRADESPVLEADVFLELDGRRVRAVHDRATNRLLYSAALSIPASGAWRLGVEVHRSPDALSFDVPLEAVEALPAAVRFWPWLVLPVVVVAVFLLHQRLRDG